MPSNNVSDPWAVESINGQPVPAANAVPQSTQSTQPSQPNPAQPKQDAASADPWDVVSVAGRPTQQPPTPPQLDGNGQPIVHSAPGTVTPTATISAVKEPTTFLGKFGRWAENVSNDLKYGTDETGIGTVLKKMGAHGVYMGNPEGVGDFMASLPLGLLKMAKGTPELAPAVIGGDKGRTWQGLKDVVGGGLQAITIPSAFVGPEESALSKEGLLNDAAGVAGKATETAGNAVKATSKAVGNAVADVSDKAKALTTDIPKETEAKLVETLGDIAEKAGFERSGTADTLVDATKHLMTSFQQRAKVAYDALDKAAPGFQELRETIANQVKAVQAQSSLDPARAEEIAEELAANKDKMAKLLTDSQKAAWEAADGDYSRFKALERFFVKAQNAATDLTSSKVTDVNRLKSGMQAMSNATRKGTPTNLLSRAFGEDAEGLKAIVQKGSEMVDDKEAAKKLLRWIVPSLGLAGAGYEGLKHLILE